MHAVPLEIEGRRRAVRPAVAHGADLQRRDGGRFPAGAAGVVDQGRSVRLHPARKKQFPAFDAGHEAAICWAAIEDRPPPPGAGRSTSYRRSTNRRTSTGRRAPNSRCIIGGSGLPRRPARVMCAELGTGTGVRAESLRRSFLGARRAPDQGFRYCNFGENC